ncbi:hypothetical protein HDU98_003562, partial [Podochytrium sp. JEL0797]
KERPLPPLGSGILDLIYQRMVFLESKVAEHCDEIWVLRKEVERLDTAITRMDSPLSASKPDYTEAETFDKEPAAQPVVHNRTASIRAVSRQNSNRTKGGTANRISN